MKQCLLYLFLFFSVSIFSQNNCNKKISSIAKKHYKKAVSNVKKNQYSEAFFNLEQAFLEDENYIDALFLYGQLKMDRQDFNIAQSFFVRILTLCPMYSSEVYWLVAEIAFNQEDYQLASDYYISYLRFLNLPKSKRELAQSNLEKAQFFIDIYSNSVPFNPSPVLDISTKDDEYLAILSPDNEMAFFTRRRVKKETGMLRAETVEDFMVSKFKKSKFNSGNIMPHPFNSYNNEGGASLTIDNNELFLTICEPTTTVKNCDIYYTYRILHDSSWAPLKRLDYPVNTSMTWESQPSISSDGNTLFFSSIREEGTGGSDIYSVTKQVDGIWGNLSCLSINTEGDEKSPFLHPDNQTLYFSSNGHSGIGGLDIYYVKKDSSGIWGAVSNIGYPINSEFDDLGLFVSTDGKTAYFSSNKLDGIGGFDLYHFPLYKEARPERVLFVKGDVLDKFGEPVLEASVELKSLTTNTVTSFDVDDATGRYVAMMTLEKGEDVILTVNDSVHAFNSLYISYDDQNFEEVKTLDFDMKMMRVGESFPINNIYFATDSFNLNQQAKYILISFSEFLNNHQNIKIAIHGHTDSFGDDDDNFVLSSKRARAVHDFLINLGVSLNQISCEGFGEKKPLYSNHDEFGRSQNRRTEFFILDK